MTEEKSSGGPPASSASAFIIGFVLLLIGYACYAAYGLHSISERKRQREVAAFIAAGKN